MKVLGDSMRANPYLLTKTTDEAVAAVFGRGHAYSGVMAIFFWIDPFIFNSSFFFLSNNDRDLVSSITSWERI